MKDSHIRLCPDCEGLIYWNSHFRAFLHDNISDCSYMETMDGNRDWDDEKRQIFLKHQDYPIRVKGELRRQAEEDYIDEDNFSR